MEDLTDEIQAFVSEMENSPAERKGCVVVTKELAEVLQKLMDKYLAMWGLGVNG